jgi:hypothetical protein
MSHLYCERCGLRVKIRAAFLHIDNCPRCLARSATVTRLVFSSDAIHPAHRRPAPSDARPAVQR